MHTTKRAENAARKLLKEYNTDDKATRNDVGTHRLLAKGNKPAIRRNFYTNPTSDAITKHLSLDIMPKKAQMERLRHDQGTTKAD